MQAKSWKTDSQFFLERPGQDFLHRGPARASFRSKARPYTPTLTQPVGLHASLRTRFPTGAATFALELRAPARMKNEGHLDGRFRAGSL